MQLVEAGQVLLDQDATTYLGDEGTGLEGVAVRHLLNHTSGLADTARAVFAIYFPGQPAPSTAEALAAYKRKRSGRAGRKVVYRNVN